jgi:hypothetical protein
LPADSSLLNGIRCWHWLLKTRCACKPLFPAEIPPASSNCRHPIPFLSPHHDCHRRWTG